MKFRLCAVLVLAILSCSALAAAEPEKDVTSAKERVQAGLALAEKEGKKLFLVSGFAECSWCRLFEKYHAAPEVKQILDKYFVLVKVDTEHEPGAKSVYKKYAEVGAPAWVIVSPEEKVLIDSDGGNGNVGYPLKGKEIAHYLKALKKTSELTKEEGEALSQMLRKTAASKKR